MRIATVTQKGQATIPAEIRAQLDVHPGDKIYFDVVDGDVIVRKVSSFDYEYHQTLSNTLSEWKSKADDEAYDDL